MPMLKPLMLAVGTAVALSACAPAAPPPVNTAADEAALKAATVSWLEAYNAGEVDKIVALYAEDAVLMPPHAPVAKGAAAIRAFLTADTTGAKAAGVKLVPGTSAAGVAGDTGWESGTYTVRNASGAAVDSGSYLSVSHKVNGKWLYYRDTYNSDRPLAPAPAAAKKAPAASKKTPAASKKRK
jgi:ketosteroid isomerase-like protein